MGLWQGAPSEQNEKESLRTKRSGGRYFRYSHSEIGATSKKPVNIKTSSQSVDST